MTTCPTNNPFGNAEMVARLIGTAYDNVKIVRDNIHHVKHVSVNLEILNTISESITELLAIYNKLIELTEVANNIPEIVAVAAKLTAIDAVYANLDNIDAIVANLSDLLELLEQVPVILTAVADAQAARDLAQQYAQEAFENANNLPFATEAEHIAGISITKATNPAGVKAAFDEWTEDVAPNNAAKTFAGIAGNNQVYVLDIAPVDAENMMVWIGGSHQRPTTDYTVTGTNLTILSNPAGLEIDTLVYAVQI